MDMLKTVNVGKIFNSRENPSTALQGARECLTSGNLDPVTFDPSLVALEAVETRLDRFSEKVARSGPPTEGNYFKYSPDRSSVLWACLSFLYNECRSSASSVRDSFIVLSHFIIGVIDAK